MVFGAELRCDHCGITSALIIDRALVPINSLQRNGEKVCTACGRVAQREARFCQGGHALVRRCIKCLVEFVVDHQLCDTCGWPQSVDPHTVEGTGLAFQRAVSDLADPSFAAVLQALGVISAGARTASGTAREAAASALLALMRSLPERSGASGGDNTTESGILAALAALGPSARQAVPVLRQRVEQVWEGGWHRRAPLINCLGAISPADALVYCRRGLDEGGKNEPRWSIDIGVGVAFALGTSAIPTLEEFCGAFSGERGQRCALAVAALRNGKPTWK
jgi:hypothetical protein